MAKKRKRSRWLAGGWWKYQMRRPLTPLFRYWREWRGPSDEELWNTWTDEVHQISQHIYHLFNRRQIFPETRQLFNDNAALKADGGYFYAWMFEIYGHFLVMSVRRELEINADVPTLRRLLADMSRRPKALSRARYLAHFDEGLPHPVLGDHRRREADNDFTKLAGPGAYMAAEILKADCATLDDAARRVILYANRVVAHRTEDAIPLNVEEVDETLEAIEKTLQKYVVILTAASLVSAEPAIQFPWKRLFRFPWINSTS